METSGKDESPIFLDRTSRATRGKRMTKLLGEEIEEDELFWNQDALKEVLFLLLYLFFNKWYKATSVWLGNFISENDFLALGVGY